MWGSPASDYKSQEQTDASLQEHMAELRAKARCGGVNHCWHFPIPSARQRFNFNKKRCCWCGAVKEEHGPYAN